MALTKDISTKLGLSDAIVKNEDDRIAVFHIRFPHSAKAYAYLSEDPSIQTGDQVLVFTKNSGNFPVIGAVEAITYCLPGGMPWPIEKTQHFYAKFIGTMPQEFLSADGIEVNSKGVAVKCDYQEIGPHMTFPKGVTTIGTYLFFHSSLHSVTIPEGVTKIETEAFAGSVDLTSVSIPASVTEIAHNAFSECFNVKYWHISPNNQNYKIIGPYIFTNHSATLFRAAERLDGELTIPKGVRKINTAAFDYCKITKAVIPEGVEVIGQEAFQSCVELIEVSLPESLKIIEGYAFANCSKLRSITIPADVQMIGVAAFSRCSNLKEVMIQGSLISLHRSMFALADLDGIDNDPVPLIAPDLPIKRVPAKLKLNAILGFIEMRKRHMDMAAAVEQGYLKYIHARGRHLEDNALRFPELKQLLMEENILPPNWPESLTNA